METTKENIETVAEWRGFPTRSAYWWDNKRTQPRTPPRLTDEEFLAAWGSVRGTVDVLPDIPTSMPK